MESSPGPGTFPICVRSFIDRSIVWDSSCMHMNLQMADYGLPRYTSVHSGQYVRSRDTGDRSTRRSPTRLLLRTTWCVWAYNSAVHSILDRVLTCHQFDPATPFANAQRVADLLGQSAVLVRQNGFGVSSVSMDSVRVAIKSRPNFAAHHVLGTLDLCQCDSKELYGYRKGDVDYSVTDSAHQHRSYCSHLLSSRMALWCAKLTQGSNCSGV